MGQSGEATEVAEKEAVGDISDRESRGERAAGGGGEKEGSVGTGVSRSRSAPDKSMSQCGEDDNDEDGSPRAAEGGEEQRSIEEEEAGGEEGEDRKVKEGKKDEEGG